jgi:hypothetical protein
VTTASGRRRIRSTNSRCRHCASHPCLQDFVAATKTFVSRSVSRMIKDIGELTVDVDGDDAQVRIRCE